MIHKTPVKFHTNIDCCKPFMCNISGIHDFNPLVGDYVRVYHNSNFEVEMKVAERHWKFIDGASPELHCWLNAPNAMSIPDFIISLRNRGFNT